MTSIVIHLSISAQEYLKLYSGTAQVVSARAIDGRRIQFPASCLRPYVTHEGVQGRFELVIDDKNKLQTLNRL